ncbi:MAG: hypothetical protein DRN15_06000 [Thermoprotei archaeon]|nr:MAG: hypothetical protein DRN15_06000 [Thermoprotei archaeon]RLF25016.1 MAG: hypothetical protein DRM97_02625 [Thermoprotei archaeon]
MEILRPKFEREAKVGARIVSHDYPIPGWRPIRVKQIHGSEIHVHKVYLYIVGISNERRICSYPTRSLLTNE